MRAYMPYLFSYMTGFPLQNSPRILDSPCRTGLDLFLLILKRKTHLNPNALRKAKIVNNFGLSECNRLKAGLVQN